MAGARTTQAEVTARENATLQVTINGEAVKATQSVSTLGDKLVTVRRARDVAEEKVLSLEAETVAADRRREAAKEQCKRLVPEFNLLSIRGSELRITITSGLPLTPLHEGMCFAVVRHTVVATQLSTLRATVSLAAQSILEHFPIAVSQAGVVGEIILWFWDRADWCLRLEAAGLGVCDLVLGPVSDHTCLVARLEEAIGQLRVM
jgi:ribosomal 50S subunit-recycling heat shock protein